MSKKRYFKIGFGLMATFILQLSIMGVALGDSGQLSMSLTFSGEIFDDTFSANNGTVSDQPWELSINYYPLGFLSGGIWKIEEGMARMEYLGERSPFAHPKDIFVNNFVWEARVKPMSLYSEGPEVRFLAYSSDGSTIVLEGVFDYHNSGHLLRLMIAPGNYLVPHSTYLTTSFTMNPETWYTMRMSVNGSNVECYIDGNLVFSAIDVNVNIGNPKIIVICGFDRNEWGYWDDFKIWNLDVQIQFSPYVIIDQIIMSDDRCDVGATQSIRIHAQWDNGTDIHGGLIYVNGKYRATNSGGWVGFNYTSSYVIKMGWQITDVICSGVLDFNQIVDSPSIIWDRVNVTLNIIDDRIDVGSTPDVFWQAFYEFDGSPFLGNVNLKIISSDTSAPTQVKKASYVVDSVKDSQYDLTVFSSNQVDCVWDRVKITQGGVSNSLTRTGNMETVWFKAVYEYDGKDFTGEPTADGGVNKIFVNYVPLIWSSFDKVWKYSTKLDDNGKLTFEVSGIEDMQFKLTTFIDEVGPQSITWETPFWETSAGVITIAGIVAVLASAAVFVFRKKVLS